MTQFNFKETYGDHQQGSANTTTKPQSGEKAQGKTMPPAMSSEG